MANFRHYILLLAAMFIVGCSSDGETKAGTVEPEVAEERTLVVYYSHTNDTRTIANELAKLVTADVVEVQPAVAGLDYAANNYAIGSALIAAIREKPDDAASYPTIKSLSVDLSDYDNVIVATPLWWSNMAAPMQTFLFQNGGKMSGKNVALIVSSHSSGISSVVGDAKRLLPDVAWMGDALWIHQNNRSRTAALLKEWISKLNFKSNTMTQKMNLAIGGTILTATLVNNSSTQTLVAALREAPITYEAHDYGNFEKVGQLPRSFPSNDKSITTEPGDIILYQGDNLCIYYDTNKWSFTRIGKIDKVSQTELKQILKVGQGNISVTLSVPSD